MRNIQDIWQAFNIQYMSLTIIRNRLELLLEDEQSSEKVKEQLAIQILGLDRLIKECLGEMNSITGQIRGLPSL